MKKYLYVFLSLFILQTSIAQVNKYEQFEGLTMTKEGRSAWISNTLGLSTDFTFKPIKNNHTQTPLEHLRFQQLYKGLEVISSQIVFHNEMDKIKSAYGSLSTDIDLDIVPTVSVASAEHIVEQLCKKKYGISSSKGMEFDIDLSIHSTSRLVYEVECHDHSHHIRHMYIVDAINGVVLEDFSKICGIGIPAQGLTTFYGMQDIIVDSISSVEYELYDPERDIRTTTNVNSIDQNIYTSDNNWILEDDNGGTSAIDVHYGAIQTHDFFLDHFGYVGMDNDDLPINSIVQLGGGIPFNNAFWTGRNMVYGSGDCNNFPTTSIDVVAHEYMHAVTEFTSGLNYNGSESAGLNEGLSDVFGKAIEYENHSETFDWKMGGKLAKNENGIRIRNLEDPWEYENPKYYQGEFYGFGAHNMGSVIGHWYYLLVEGGMYENEVGETYDLTSISREDAIQIIFNAMTQYALPTSGYAEVAKFTQLSAIEIFGENSIQHNSISEAWNAVGVNDSGPAVNYDLSIDLRLPSIACITGDPVSFEIDLTNLGDITISAGKVLTFEIVNASDVYQDFTLLEDLNKNDRISIPIAEGPVIDDDFSSQFIDVNLQLVDDNTENNFISELIRATGYESLDVRLDVVQQDMYGCGREVLEFYIELENESCNPLELGTQFELQVYQEISEIYSETVEIDRVLHKDETLVFEIEIPYDESMEVLQFIAMNPLDVENDNNIRSEEILTNKQIDDKQLFEFDNVEEYKDVLNVSNDFVFFPVEYEGESMLVTTGFSTQLQPLCPEIPDFFELGGSTQFIKACVDFSDWIEPTLSFDLIQKRNILYEDEPDHELHNITKVQWSSAEESGTEYIYGQPHGEKIFHKINLPSQFVGEVEFSFFHMTGEPFSLMYGDFSTYDITFLDNLKFNDSSVSTVDEDLSLSIYPNPASSKLYIDTDLAIQNIELYTTLGQQMLRTTGQSRVVDIDELPNGMYILKLYTEGNQVVERSFVKI